ncbi:hydroperoxide isomerase ALOXE3-like [Gymnogyps californianus]|uniref:hydroperoxide isomerase ALOXE3-like n=1 Tax=Gymnogyps californianus TaxID=33616 RepID=UPI0021C75E4C|nr:hydroperoxide isomerase ALOXE3-like [Gymnogyps californianus]
MAVYKVKVATGDILQAGTRNSISITLVGSRGESRQTSLNSWFQPGMEKDLTVRCERDLGPVVLIRLHKWRLFLEDAWYCKDVRVTAPDGTLYRFPCYHWLEGVTTVQFREGSGKKLADDELEVLKEHRRQELKARQEAYQWKNFADGWPRCLNVDSILELDSNVQFSCVRATTFTGALIFQRASHLLAAFLLRPTSWKSLDEMRSIFSRTRGREIVPEYVARHWREDDFFGYQFLNGNNPIIIQQCMALPAKFPVTPEMVAGSLGGGTNLGKEMQEGRIFIVDYEVLEGIPASIIHGRQQHMAAPLCLLHQGADGRLRPVAIQLSQTPGPTSPIFLPSDAEWDWLLAKTWVRNADFYSHQLLTHLLRTHLFGEVFAIATLRQLPSCHPLFKLLIPHFHFTLHINTLARSVLINPGGVITKGSGVTYEGMLLIVQRGLEKVTYTSLCLPDDIRHRGMAHLPNYHYRDDGMSLWEAIESFVSGIVAFYYGEDKAVSGDAELQAWVMDIFTNGFLGRTSSGIPSSLQTVAELNKFLTMVVFTCSVQHAAVNNGQYDLGAFLPNSPSSMRHPPPAEKGKAFLQHFLDTIPEVDTTANILVALILLSSRLKDMRFLGQYPEERFTEVEPRRLIRTFQGRLEEIRDSIEERNHHAELRYNYMNPLETENSISI